MGATGKNAIKKLLELKVPVRVLVHKTDARSATRWKQFRHCLYCQCSDGYPGKSRDKPTKLSA